MRRLALAAAALLLAGRVHAVKIERVPAALSGGATEVAAERLLVKFSTGADAGQKAAVLAAARASVLNDMPGLGWTVLQLSTGEGVMTALNAVKNLPGVDRVSPDAVVRMHAYPTDPAVPQQYSLSNTSAFSGWEYTTGLNTADGKPVTIVIVDAGIDGSGQPDVDPKLLDVITAGATKSQFFNPDAGGAQSNDSLPTPACAHGTQTASVAAAVANNGVGIAGVSWGARLISLKVFNNADCNSDCSDKAFPGSCSTTDSAMAAAVNYAANTLQGAAAVGHAVVNMSIGGPGSCGGTLPLTQAALATALGKSVPVTISAGNDAGAVNAPANCAGTGGAAAGIIPVGSTNSSDKISWFSSNGAELAAHGVVAPGENVAVDTVNGNTATNSGTSFSAPFVAGLAALMIAAKSPVLTPPQIETALRGGADSIGDTSARQGAGRVDVFRTLRLVVNGTLATFEGDQKAIAFPNPFRLAQSPIATITVPTSLQGSNTSIKIFTADGQLVRELTGLTWDGKNGDGALVASGTYLFLVKTDKGTTRGRLAVIR